MPNKPLLSFKKIYANPQKELKMISKLIKDATNRSKNGTQILEGQVKTGQDLYADFVSKYSRVQ